MKIIISGNIGSGKTTILKRVNQHFQYDEIIIDDFRVKYGDESLDGEFLARDNFYLAIKSDKNQFIECTGVGSVAEKLFEHLKNFNEPIILLILSVTKEACLKRIEKRDWKIPFPFKKEPLYEKLSRIEKSLDIETITKELSYLEKLIVVSKKNEHLNDIDSITNQILSLIKQA